jgi:hypothetical protein
MLGQFLVAIGDLEARIIALHTHLAVMRGDDFPKRQEPVAHARYQGKTWDGRGFYRRSARAERRNGKPLARLAAFFGQSAAIVLLGPLATGISG